MFMNKNRQSTSSSVGGMDDLQFYILFNSILVKSGRWVGDNDRLCAVEPCL